MIESPESFPATRGALSRNAMANVVGDVLVLAVGFLTVPLLITNLGAEAYGIWITALLVRDSTKLLVSGFSRTLTRNVAAGSVSLEVAASWLNLYAITGLATSVALVIPFFVWRDSLSTQVLALVGISSFANIMTAFCIDYLAGSSRFLAINLINAIFALARLAVFFLVLRAGGSLNSIAVAYLALTFAMALVFVFILRSSLTGLRFASIADSRQLFIREWRTGVASQGLDVVNLVLWNGPTFVVAGLGGASMMASYSVGSRVPMNFATVTAKATEVVYPAASRQLHWDLVQHSTANVMLLAVPVCSIFIVFPEMLLQLWLGAAVPAHANTVLRFFGIAIIFESLAAASMQALWGTSRTRPLTRFIAIAALLNVVGAAAVVRPYGAAGVSMVFAASLAVFSMLTLGHLLKVMKTGWLTAFVGVAKETALPIGASILLVLAIWMSGRAMDLWMSAFAALLIVSPCALVLLFRLRTDA